VSHQTRGVVPSCKGDADHSRSRRLLGPFTATGAGCLSERNAPWTARRRPEKGGEHRPGDRGKPSGTTTVRRRLPAPLRRSPVPPVGPRTASGVISLRNTAPPRNPDLPGDTTENSWGSKRSAARSRWPPWIRRSPLELTAPSCRRPPRLCTFPCNSRHFTLNFCRRPVQSGARKGDFRPSSVATPRLPGNLWRCLQVKRGL